jgi:hypothetical protein
MISLQAFLLLQEGEVGFQREKREETLGDSQYKIEVSLLPLFVGSPVLL